MQINKQAWMRFPSTRRERVPAIVATVNSQGSFDGQYHSPNAVASNTVQCWMQAMLDETTQRPEDLHGIARGRLARQKAAMPFTIDFGSMDGRASELHVPFFASFMMPVVPVALPLLIANYLKRRMIP